MVEFFQNLLNLFDALNPSEVLLQLVAVLIKLWGLVPTVMGVLFTFAIIFFLLRLLPL